MTSIEANSREALTALYVAADAMLEGRDLERVQVDALEEAASFALSRPEDVDAAVSAGPPDCALFDPEEWFPVSSTAGINDADRLAAERDRAEELCEFCPVRGACLALSYEISGGAEYGVWAGLTPRDRRELAPVWRTLQKRLADEQPEDSDEAGGVRDAA